MSKRIIGIAGLIGSGKDTAADYLINSHNFIKLSFATSLKQVVATVFHWDLDLLNGFTNESRIWREEIDTWWANKLGIPNLTPRWVLQHWGTEVCRSGFHQDIWIRSLEKRIEAVSKNVVITDARFPNEFQMIKEMHGNVIRIKRGSDPHWFNDASNLNILEKTDPEWNNSYNRLFLQSVHVSETAWAGLPFDAVIINDKTIEDLNSQIEDFLKSR